MNETGVQEPSSLERLSLCLVYAEMEFPRIITILTDMEEIAYAEAGEIVSGA